MYEITNELCSLNFILTNYKIRLNCNYLILFYIILNVRIVLFLLNKH